LINKPQYFFSEANTNTIAASNINSTYWGFDNDVNDLNGIYNGVLVNGASFSNNTYFGYGFTLALNSSANTFALVRSPFFNLSYTSFTVEAWIYGLTLAGNNSIFSQCECNTCQDQCLHLMIRNSKMYMGFMLDDLVGTTSLSSYTWHHVAYVYDHSCGTQMIYLQGVLDGIQTSIGPYQGQNGSIMIGASELSSSSFNGYIDNMRVSTSAKSDNSILDDATMVVHFSFDGSTLTEDVGSNKMNGSLSNVTAVLGRVGQGLNFNGSLCYFQAYGFYQLGQTNKPFSFALWIYPYSVTGGTLIHITTLSTSGGTWCQDMVGFTSSGHIAFYVNGASAQLVGPIIFIGQWTHIGFTYAQTNGQIMYINGVKYNSTGAAPWISSGVIDWLTIGYNFGVCSPAPISGGYYHGIIDEFYVYRRELNASEVHTLANP
jgi:hypothetical protein